MARLAFLGLGIMGYPMARNLMRAGHKVALWSHTQAKAKELAQAENGEAFGTPAEAVANAEGVFSCVGDTQMSEEVMLGGEGVIAGAKPGTIVADCSTISPDASRAMAEQLGAKGIRFLDTPCTGSKPGAEGATLTFMIGGEQRLFETIKPWLEAMGKQFYYCGKQGMGLQAKLTQNLILSNILQAFNEGMVLSTKGGVAPDLMLDILNNSAAKSGLISYKAPFVFKRDFSTNFSTKWMHKDVTLALESADSMSVPLALTTVTEHLFRTAISKGYGEDDMCATIQVLEELAGVQVKT